MHAGSSEVLALLLGWRQVGSGSRTANLSSRHWLQVECTESASTDRYNPEHAHKSQP